MTRAECKEAASTLYRDLASGAVAKLGIVEVQVYLSENHCRLTQTERERAEIGIIREIVNLAATEGVRMLK